ncbi:uncharacterized protein LOC136035556 [Artemia franciscana]|uniref:Uncharacterized protein n=1 Tax=Artemia franciscana TaxID=6661 RepID=A0AA88LCH2_ARTSF|nr:hypothetical protein QYM36_003431 [Artemia franciscana]
MGRHPVRTYISVLLLTLALAEDEPDTGHAWSVTHSSQEVRPAYVLFRAPRLKNFPRFPLLPNKSGFKREAITPQLSRRQDNTLEFQFQQPQVPNFGFPFGDLDRRREQFENQRPRSQLVVQPGDRVNLVVPGERFQQVPDVLSELQKGMAEKVFLAPPVAPPPRGYSTVDIPYITNQISGQPPAVFVAPASLPLPKGYTRVSIPVRGITFLKSATTETPLPNGDVRLAKPVETVEEALRQDGGTNGRPFDNSVFDDNFRVPSNVREEPKDPRVFAQVPQRPAFENSEERFDSNKPAQELSQGPSFPVNVAQQQFFPESEEDNEDEDLATEENESEEENDEEVFDNDRFEPSPPQFQEENQSRDSNFRNEQSQIPPTDEQLFRPIAPFQEQDFVPVRPQQNLPQQTQTLIQDGPSPKWQQNFQPPQSFDFFGRPTPSSGVSSFGSDQFEDPKQVPEGNIFSQEEEDEKEPTTTVSLINLDYEVNPEPEQNEFDDKFADQSLKTSEEDSQSFEFDSSAFGQKINSQQNPHMLHSLPDEEPKQIQEEEQKSKLNDNQENFSTEDHKEEKNLFQNSPMIFTDIENQNIQPEINHDTGALQHESDGSFFTSAPAIPVEPSSTQLLTQAVTEATFLREEFTAPSTTGQSATTDISKISEAPKRRKKIVIRKRIRTTTTTEAPATDLSETQKVTRKFVRRPISSTTTTQPALIEVALPTEVSNIELLKENNSFNTENSAIPITEVSTVVPEKMEQEVVSTTDIPSRRVTRPLFRRTKPTRTTTEATGITDALPASTTKLPSLLTRRTKVIYRRTKPTTTARPIDQNVEESQNAVQSNNELPKEENKGPIFGAKQPTGERRKIKVAVKKRPLTSAPSLNTTPRSESASEEPSLVDTVHQMMQAKREKESSSAIDLSAEASNEHTEEHLHAESSKNNVIGISTATEVSLMYELCFRGRCVKVNQ